MTTGAERQVRRARASGDGRTPLPVLALLLLVLIPITACDAVSGVLEAELEGRVTDSDLNNPDLAPVLARSAQGDFECAFRGHQLAIEAGWGNAFQYVDQLIEMIVIANRKDRTREFGQSDCTSARDPYWFAMHRARAQGARAVERIQAMPEGSVEARDFLIGKGYVFEAYATEHLAEPWCEMVFDGSGERVSRETALRRAEDRFTKAMDRFQTALSGPRAEEADELMNLARVGRARARLNLGDDAGALEDARAVEEGFMFFATFDATPSRRQNMTEDLQDDFLLHPRSRKIGIMPDGRTLTPEGDPVKIETTVSAGGEQRTIDGSPDAVPDPRIQSEFLGIHSSGPDWWIQTNFTQPGTDMPFASWREAQLMIAEIEGGATAAGIINELRDRVGELPWVSGNPDLPDFDSTGMDDDEIMQHVFEERRRELFLQGRKVGDDLRTGEYETWDQDTSPVGQQIGDNLCIPVPDRLETGVGQT